MMKVAAIQYRPVPRDIPTNIDRLATLIEEAAAAGAKIIVMPELCTTGYSMMNHEEAQAVAEVLTEPLPMLSMEIFAGLAATLGVHLVWGLVETEGGKLFNTQVYMPPDGGWVSYRKINPFSSDYLWMTPGEDNPPVVTVTVDQEPPLNVGLLICRDVRDKKDAEWDDFYEPGDADLVCLSANWGRGAFPATSWIDFAVRNKTTLLVSNRYGQEIPNDFGHGGICLVYADGSVMCDGLQWGRDCIVYGEI